MRPPGVAGRGWVHQRARTENIEETFLTLVTRYLTAVSGRTRIINYCYVETLPCGVCCRLTSKAREGDLLALHQTNLRELPLITSLSGCCGAVPLWKGWLQALVCP